MIRLFFSYLILACLCTYPILFSSVKADEDDSTLTPTSCDSTWQSAVCANLGNISNPFEGIASCFASDSFHLNCSNSSQAYWDGFTAAVSGDKANLGAPALDGIYLTGYLTFINLTWNLSLFKDAAACSLPIAADLVDFYIPEVIDLSSFANGSFNLSSYNHILLFDCANLPPVYSKEENTVCQAYQQQCGYSWNNPCMQIPVPAQQLRLHETLSNFSCTSFTFFVAAETSPSISTWSPGLIQLVYSDWKCEACYVSNGTCVYNKTTHIYQECACRNGKVSATDCNNISSCNGSSCNKSSKVAVIVVPTGIAGAVVIIGLIVLNWCKRTRSTPTKIRQLSLAERLTRPKLFQARSFIISHFDLAGLTECPTEYPYASIVLATEKFRNLVGKGGFGTVYKGILDNATGNSNAHVAVKVLEVRSEESKKHFLNEVASIGRIHHVNVVRLLGFCIEESHGMLVYEYVVNGSLDKWLFYQSGSHNKVLTWDERYAIAVGVAKGLGYLHEECRHRIVHCDIKPQNILLDERMRPKIADFGLARLMGREESQVVTLARGTPGYMGPEFWSRGESQLSTKFDVYSFGMVLLELISGQRNFGQDMCFPEMAYDAAMRGEYESILDVKLGIRKAGDHDYIISDGMRSQQVRTTLLVALWCIQDHPTNRPSMKQVVQYLEGGASIDAQPPQPAIASSISTSAQEPLHISNGGHCDITPISQGR